MVTKAKKALLASLAAFLCVMLTVFGLSMSVSLSETAKAADETPAEVAEVNGVKFATLAEAVNAVSDGGKIVVYSGVYTIPNVTYTEKSFTISAGVDQTVSFDMSVAHAIHGAKVSFNNVTFDYKTNNNYIGLQHADTLTYNRCTINGMVFLYATNETFNGCTFNQTSKDAYNVWTYGAKNVAFNRCVFKSAGKSVLVYNEGANPKTDLTVSETKFVASETVDGKAAIEIDTSRMAGGTTITIDDKTTATNFAAGSNSGSTLWNDKKQTADTNKNTTITVADEVVYAPYVVAIGEVKYFSLTAAIAAAKAGDTVKLLADVEQNSEVSINKNITLDLNGKKIYNTKDIWHDTDPVIVSLIAIRDGAEVTVMGDGTIAAKADDCYTIDIVNGKLTIENGTFVGNISVVQVQKGRLTINGGTFSLIQKMTDGKGEDRYLINCIDAAFTANDAKVAIYGGSFAGFDPNVSPEAKVDGKVPSYAAPGVGITKNVNGSFMAEANMAAQILDSDGNSVKAYATLAEAIAAAKDGETVKLLADATADVVVDKNITLDLGGNTLTGTNSGKATLTIAKGATATVKNGSVIGTSSFYNIQNNGTATFESLTATAGNTGSSMIDNWGTLTITSGTYTGGMDTVKSEEGSKLTINGGKFKNSFGKKWSYTATILVYGDTLITGGEFIQETSNTSSYAKVVMTGVVDGYTSITKVTGGSFTSTRGIFWALGKATSDNFEVSGGTFNKSISEGFCADGFIPTKQADGTYGVKEGKYVAKVGSTKYETLADAIRLAANGKTVTLLDNITLTEQLVIGKNLTIDLGGFTLTSNYSLGASGANIYAIVLKAAVTIKNGKIVADNARVIGAYGAMIMDGVTVENGIIGGHATIGLSGAGLEYVIRNSTINGAYSVSIFANNATVTIENSNITGRGPALYHNGSNYGLRLTVTDTTLTSAACSVYISGSASMKDQADNRNNADGYQQATFTRCTISGTNGIEVKYTNLTLNSCNISATVKTPTYEQNNNGSTASGFAVVSTDNATGGTTPAPKGTIAVSGEGNYVGAIGIGTLVKNKYEGFEDASYAVSGGKFNHAILPEYCAEGFIPTKNTDGTFGVKEGTYVAKIGEAGYETLAEAIAAAKAGDTITLLANVADFEGAVVTKNLTFDFGDYTITGKTGATVLHVKNAKVTLNGKTGGIDGGAGGDNIAVRADTGAEVIINGGVYTVGADANGLGNSTVYVTDNGKVTINGGTFSSKAAYNGKYYVLNVQNSAKGTFVVKGGTFKDFDPLSGDDNLGGNFAPEGYGANRDENGNFTIVAGVVAQVKNASGKSVKAYATLEEAVNAAPRNAIVTLLANTKENVTIAKALTLDLNGHTINGGTEKGKPAVTVKARVTIKDSSADQTGTIMREDTAENSGVSSHYVIDVQGVGRLTFESGNVINHSGVVGVKGASLVRVGDDSVRKQPGLVINGGTFTQDNFIVIKVDRGYFTLNGGTLNSANSYAIENWFNATVKGGTVNGAVSSWTYSGGFNSTLDILGGTINGDVTSVNYGNATDKKAKVSVTGGTITGELDTRSYDPATGELASINDATKATIGITGGTFSKDPTKYVVEESAIIKNADGTFGVAKAYLAKVGDTSYYTMEEAFEAQTASGEAIVLLRDYTTGSTFNSGSIDRVVDLNRHTWTYTGTRMNDAAFKINNPNVTLTVKNGTIISNMMVGVIPSAVSEMDGTIIAYDNAGLVFEGVEMTSNGSSGIETNGNNTDDSVTLKDSTLNVPDGFGIYFPSSGTLTIDNSKIIAKTMGVQVCSGELHINAGSAITVTGDAVPKAENDGAIQDGAAISVVNRTGYKGLSNIVITGGTFTAKAGNDAIKAYDWNNAEKTESAFTKADLVAVSGGTFSSEVKKDYLANGFRLTKTGESYGVTAKYIETTHVSLGTALSFSYKLRVLNKEETIKNAKASYRTVRGNLVEIDMTLVNGYYVFDGITPQMLDRKISVNVYIGDTVVYDVVDYSILDYLQDLLKTDLGTKATVTKQLVADLAFYGKAAMKYVGYTTTVVDKFIADNGLTQSTGDITGVATSSGTEKVANVSVQFASQNKILIGVAESVFNDYSYTIKVNGTEIANELWQTDVVDGYRVYVSDGFAASYITDKDHYVEVEVLKNEVSVQKVQCNVAGYCMKMAENAKMGELAKATYYYGVSAAKYAAIIKG